jgi:hypothetical protein
MSFIQNLSVFITRIHREDANEEFIKRTFYDQEIACVRRIDFLKCRDSRASSASSKVYYQAKIYFHYWFKNQIAYNVQRRILNPNNSGARIIYTDPWYWIVLKNINPMTEMELCINERLEYLEKTMTRRMKRTQNDLGSISEQMATLQSDVERLKEQAKTKIPQNTHIRFCYADAEATATKATANQCAETTANQCAEATANQCAEATANQCVEKVLKEMTLQEPALYEWNDYYDQIEQDQEDSDDYEQLYRPTWTLHRKERKEREKDYCEESQLGHTNEEFEMI